MKNFDIAALTAGLRKISEGFAILADAIDNTVGTVTKVSALINEQPETPALLETKAAVKEPTFEEVRGVLADKAAKGYRAEVKAVIKKYGAANLSGLETHPELFSEIMTDAEAIGNAG